MIHGADSNPDPDLKPRFGALMSIHYSYADFGPRFVIFIIHGAESNPDPDLGPLFGAITSKHESWETESHPDPNFGPRFGANMITKLLQKIHPLFF